MRRVRALAMAALAVFAVSHPAAAQTAPIPQEPLARFITDLLASGGRVDSTAVNELPDFLIAPQWGEMPALMNQAIGMQLSTFPSTLGLDASRPGWESVPAHTGFAPAFAIHSGSMGRGKLSASFNYQNTTFRSLDGIALDSGQIGFVFKTPAALLPEFGREVLQESLSLQLRRDIATFALVFGATERLDIGVAVPIVHLEAEGQVRSQLYKAVGGSMPDRHFFDVYPATPLQYSNCATSSVDVPGVNRAGQGTVTQPLEARYDMVELATRTVYRRCDANGLGDVVVHGRYRFGSPGTTGIAAAVDVQLPTGDPDNLLGTGTTRTTAAVIWSGQAGRFAPHVNFGYTFSTGTGSALFNSFGDGKLPPQGLSLEYPSEIDFAAGTDMVFFRRLTAAIDIFGRQIQDLQRFRVDDNTSAALDPGDPTVPGTLLQSNGTGALLLVGLASAQVALTDRTLLKSNLVFPLPGGGLKPNVGVGVGLGFRF
jgi:hypothetical protein